MPASELAMSINHRNEKAGQFFSISVDTSEKKGRILVSYHEVFTG
jgi:hypothetical protein